MGVDELVVAHVPFARWVAWKHRRVCPKSWGDDIEAAAFEGLVRAARSFEPDNGALFTSYSYFRMRGTILDELRHLANKSRRQGVDVTVEPLADRNGDSIGEWPAEWNADPAVIVEEATGARQQADGLLSVLTDHDRQLVRWYYYDQLTLAEIGARVGVTESRICQRLASLRSRLARRIHTIQMS